MTVLHRAENMPTWHLRCDRCGQHSWHEDAAHAPPAPHVCSDCERGESEAVAPAQEGAAAQHGTAGQDEQEQGNGTRQHRHACATGQQERAARSVRIADIPLALRAEITALRALGDALHDALRAHLASGGSLDDTASAHLVALRGRVDRASSVLVQALHELAGQTPGPRG